MDVAVSWYLLILIGGVLSFLVIIGGIVFLAVFVTRRQSQGNDLLSSLKEENHRLREEIDRLKRDKA